MDPRDANAAGTSRPEETYKLIRKLGSGGFGVVELVQRSDNNELFARKSVDIFNLRAGDVKVLSNEAATLKLLRNEHIVSLVEFHEHWTRRSAELSLIMEYCEGGDLEHYITLCAREYKAHARDMKIPEDLVFLWLEQLAEALQVSVREVTWSA